MEKAEILQAGDSPVTTLECQTGPSRRILFVDDESPIRELVTEVLSRSGYRVDAAEDGAVAWDILQSGRYDLLVTDNIMPKVSGVELLNNLRAAHLNLPVIMATGTLPQYECSQSPGFRPVTTLLKPYTGAEMLRAVDSVLNETDGTAAFPED